MCGCNSALIPLCIRCYDVSLINKVSSLNWLQIKDKTTELNLIDTQLISIKDLFAYSFIRFIVNIAMHFKPTHSSFFYLFYTWI